MRTTGIKTMTRGAVAFLIALTLSACGCKHETAFVRDALEATCTEDGYTGDRYCPECEKIIEKGEALPASGHTEDRRGIQEATCQKEGYTGDVYCAVCGERLLMGEIIEKLPHTEERIGVQEATCAQDGFTGNAICSVCSETLERGEKIERPPHDWEVSNSFEATCLKQGYEGDLRCRVCGTERQGEALPFKDHSFEDGVCTECGWLTPGLYIDGELVYTWEELEENNYVTVNAKGQLVTTQGNFQYGTLVIGEDVTYIDGNYSSGFKNANVCEVWIPRSVTELGNYLIYRNGAIESVIMYCQIDELKYSSFINVDSCEGALKNVVLPDSLKRIGQEAFAGCTGLTSIDWPASLEYIGREAFWGSGLREAILPEGVTSIGQAAFGNSALTVCVLPSTLEETKGGVFRDCQKLTSVDMSACEKLTELQEMIFVNCSALTNVKLPPNLKSMEGRMFGGCNSLRSLSLPEGFTTLNLNTYYASLKDSGIAEIVIPKSMITIGNLGGCPITKIKYRGTEAQWKMTTGYGQFPNATMEYNYDGE